jgi:hypothetical protein
MTVTIEDHKLFLYTKPPMLLWSWASWTKFSPPQSLLQMTLMIDYDFFLAEHATNVVDKFVLGSIKEMF